MYSQSLAKFFCGMEDSYTKFHEDGFVKTLSTNDYRLLTNDSRLLKRCPDKTAKRSNKGIGEKGQTKICREF